MMANRDTLELCGVVLLALVGCVLALIMVIGFLLLPVKTANQAPSRLADPAAMTVHMGNPGN
jgi:hypothetical protein